MLYRLKFDSALHDQWFLETPVHVSGDKGAFWRLTGGQALKGEDLEGWSTAVGEVGQKLAMSFAGFDVPIVDSTVANLFALHASDDVQLPPIKIKGEPLGYRLLVATRLLKCVDEQRSEFTRWLPEDGRPEKVGEYRMVMRLRLDANVVPKSVQIFRVAGWEVALIVSENLAKLLRGCVREGLSYEPVA
jgi:hypothetical protein